jgi:uncharacterized membrane protein (DUF2068 family)
VRWEFSRRIELTLGVRLIILDRAVKAVALTLGGIVLLVTVRNGALEEFADRLQAELNVSPGSHLWLRLTNYAVSHFTALGVGTQVALAVAVFLYGLLEAFEGVGLLLHRRWAEYLVLLATCAFIPLEIDELILHPTPFKAIAFVINVVIAVYLVWRKRLFLDRPPAAVMAPGC